VDLNAISVIDHTRQYPGWVYAAGKDVEPEIVEKIRQVLLELDIENSDHAMILQQAHFRGFIAATDSDFDPIRDLINQVGGQLND
jgi:phosphonate transport system substrate-binding protein